MPIHVTSESSILEVCMSSQHHTEPGGGDCSRTVIQQAKIFEARGVLELNAHHSPQLALKTSCRRDALALLDPLTTISISQSSLHSLTLVDKVKSTSARVQRCEPQNSGRCAQQFLADK